MYEEMNLDVNEVKDVEKVIVETAKSGKGGIGKVMIFAGAILTAVVGGLVFRNRNNKNKTEETVEEATCDESTEETSEDNSTDKSTEE